MLNKIRKALTRDTIVAIFASDKLSNMKNMCAKSGGFSLIHTLGGHMRFLLAVLGVALLLAGQLQAQTTNTLSVVQFVDANTVVASGAAGTFVRSDDAGVTWTTRPTGVSDYLVGISFSSVSIGTIVGGNPLVGTQTVIRTVDGGSSWFSQSTGNTKVLKGVSFVDANTGWAVGNSGTILKTVDGGSSWEAQSSGITENLQEVQFLDANTGIAVGDWGRILRTTNGGATWVIQPSGSNIFFYGVRFINALIGTVVGNAGTVLRTTNGGASWTTQSSGTAANLYSAWFVDANNGWATGASGTIRRTTNGGSTWAGQTSGTTADLGGVAFKDVNTGIVVGINGTILRTVNGGATWGPPSGGGYVSNQYPVLAGWNIVSVPLTVADARKTILFPTATSSALAYTSSGYVARDTLWNGIGHWLFFPSAQNIGIAGTLRMRDTIAMSAGWNLIGTISDSVQTTTIQWIPPTTIASQFLGYSSGYSPASVLKPSKAYWVFTVEPGLLVLSSASSLNKESLPRSYPIDKAATIMVSDVLNSKQTLHVSSEPLETKDLVFFMLPPRPPAGIFDVRFSTNRMLEAVKEGESRTIPIQISDAQYPLTIRWELKDQPLTASLIVGVKELKMSGNGSATITDPEASIALKLVGQSALPKEVGLLQNFPNPFNPSTTIMYNLPRDSRVSLKLFNLLGQEVATLVDEEQKAGYKSVEWNASNITSGVYLYRIQAGDFVASKKLLLLK